MKKINKQNLKNLKKKKKKKKEKKNSFIVNTVASRNSVSRNSGISHYSGQIE